MPFEVADQTGVLLEMMPFARTLGIENVSASPDLVLGRVPWDEKLCTSFGVMHGGVLMSLADSVAAFCAVLNLPEGAGTSTIESKINFLRAVRSGYVEARARPLHVGRTTIVIDTELYDDQDRLVGRVTQTQAVLAARS
jgi:1,4-dihydroxy-2-naphthoyl-CoA hydrolase